MSTIEELEERLKRYQDFVHELAAREHGQFCDSQYGLSCDCIVGDAAAVVMGSPRKAFPVRTCRTCAWQTTSTSTIDGCTACGDDDGLRPRHFLTRNKEETPAPGKAEEAP